LYSLSLKTGKATSEVVEWTNVEGSEVFSWKLAWRRELFVWKKQQHR